MFFTDGSANDWADVIKAEAIQKGNDAANMLPSELINRLDLEKFPEDIFTEASKAIGIPYNKEGLLAYRTRIIERKN